MSLSRSPAASSKRESPRSRLLGGSSWKRTGFAASRLIELGVVDTNPALQKNRTHTFLALGARPVATPTLDELESITVECVPLAEIPALVARGEITHSLVIAALYFYSAYAGGFTAEPPGSA